MLLNPGSPVVFNLIVCSARQVLCYLRPPMKIKKMEYIIVSLHFSGCVTLNFSLGFIIYVIKWRDHVPISPAGVKFKNQKLFFESDVSTSNIWAEIVQPPQSAAFSSSFQACFNDEVVLVKFFPGTEKEKCIETNNNSLILCFCLYFTYKYAMISSAICLVFLISLWVRLAKE